MNASIALAQNLLSVIASGGIVDADGTQSLARLTELAKSVAATPSPDCAATRAQARVIYGSDDVEIDDDCQFSVADDGTWVGGWLWVPHQEDEAA